MLTRNRVALLLVMALSLTGCDLFGTSSTPPALVTQAAVETEPSAPSAPAPSVTLTSTTTEVKVGQEVTLTGKAVSVGNPQYILRLDVTGGTTPAVTFTVAAGQSLPAVAAAAGTNFDLVSASATQTDVTYVLRAVQAGKVDAGLTASGEVPGPNNVFAPGNTSSQTLALNVTAPVPSAQLGIEPSATQVGIGGEITVSLQNTGASAFKTYELTVTTGTTVEKFSLPIGTNFQPAAPKPDSVFEVVSAADFAASTGFILKALKAGTVTVQGTATGDGGLLGQSEAVTLAVQDGTGGPTGSTAGASTRTHTVQSGETLYSISRAYGADWQQVASANNLQDPYVIKPGDVLTIPGAKVYVVQQGDWLYKIARQFGLNWEDIARLNSLMTPYLIYPGDVLALP